MLKWLNNKKKDNKGFSLVELIIVVAIMAILVGLLAPQYIKYVEKSRKSSDASNLSEMVNALQIYAADAETNIPQGDYTITINDEGSRVTAENGGDANVAKTAIEATAPDFETIKMKSNKWNTTNDENKVVAATQIKAVVKVDKDGATTVSYDPVELQKFVKGTGSTSSK